MTIDIYKCTEEMFYGYKTALTLIKEYTNNTYLIKIENIFIGMIMIDEETEDSVFVYEFEVFMPYRNKGYGRNIVSFIQDEYNMISLYPINKDASEFWKACGFRECCDECGTQILVWKR